MEIKFEKNEFGVTKKQFHVSDKFKHCLNNIDKNRIGTKMNELDKDELYVLLLAALDLTKEVNDIMESNLLAFKPELIDIKKYTSRTNVDGENPFLDTLIGDLCILGGEYDYILMDNNNNNKM